MPGIALAVIVAVDLLLWEASVLGLLVVAPLLAANVTPARATAVYGVVAWCAAALLGVRHGDYVPGERLLAQSIRLAFLALAALAAVLLARDRVRREQRLTQVIKVAEAAQRAILLPVPGRLGPAHVAVHYESAAQDALIGGDLYGMVLTPYGLRVLVGDVRGKGLEAVRMSAQVLAAFRERADDDPDLGTLIDHIDRAVERCLESEEDFVTAVLVQIARNGTVTIANAGHPYPYVLTRGRVRPLEPPVPSPPLGLGGRAPTARLNLHPGDRVLLYTDGLTEARNPQTGAFLSPQAIMGAVAGGAGPADVVTALRDDVLQWSGGALNDDIALVVIEYRDGERERPEPEAPAAPGRERDPATTG